MVNSDSRKPRRITLWIKILSAVIGAGVVIAMGGLTVAVGGTDAHADSGTTAGTAKTRTAPPSAPETPSAAPTLKVQSWRCWDIFPSKC